MADGANGISLIEAQENYRQVGACHGDSVPQVRRPRGDEPLADGWRMIDLEVDVIERDTDPTHRPWPADLERLYWWRGDYYLRADAPPPAPLGARDQRLKALIADVVQRVPESSSVLEQTLRDYELPAPIPFCSHLAVLVLDAIDRGDPELAQRTAEALNSWLDDDDGEVANAVAVGYLEDDRWDRDDLSDVTASWPSQIREEAMRQFTHRRTSGWEPEF